MACIRLNLITSPTLQMPPARTFAAFPSTHWSLVREIQTGEPEAALALTKICERYWYPIYAFLRRSGYGRSDAEDLTQTFFQRLIERDTFNTFEPGGTKLRSFLLGCLKHTLSDCGRHDNAQKRGGLVPHVSFDGMEADERYLHEPRDKRDPEWLFTQNWAHQLLATVREQLRASFTQSRRLEVFDALLPYITLDDDQPSYREIAEKIGGSEANARILVFRLREKFRDLLREEIALTVGSPEEIQSEMDWLKSVLAEP